MLRIIVQCLLCVIFALGARSAWAAVEPEEVKLEEEPQARSGKGDGAKKSATKKKKKKKKRRRRKPAADREPAAERAEPRPKKRARPRRERSSPPARAAASAPAENVEPGGLECSPAVSEVEIRRPIPISCGVTREGVSKIEIRYKTPNKRKFTRLTLKKSGSEWVGEIPCGATAKTGELKVQFNARGAGNKLVARIDTVTIQLVQSTQEPPPSLPGQQAPMRCYEPAECPAEFRGTEACPGTKGASGKSRSWGASCSASSECQKGLACISGTCDQPPACDVTADCPSGGECIDGECSFPDPDEAASRLTNPRFNWLGLHFGVDLTIASEAVGVCGDETEDSKSYTCFRGGDPYEGPVNLEYRSGGTVPGGFRMGTMRVMASYERWFGRFAAGARVGFAFGGAPQDFSPIHLEGRFLYALRRDPMRNRLRPYLGIAGGLAQTDLKSQVSVVDCSESNAACPEATVEELRTTGVPGAEVLQLDAYRQGSKLFFGPTFGVVYAFSNDSGIQLNVNVAFPDLVIQPSIGYVLGL